MPEPDLSPYILEDGGALDMARCPDCWERRAHIERYQFACMVLAGGMRVLDYGCGVGYGSRMMADIGNMVTGYDTSEAALKRARQNQNFMNKYPIRSQEEIRFTNLPPPGELDACVAFEVLEHLEDPAAFVDTVNARHLVASVPVIQTVGHNKHHKHDFTQESFRELIERRFTIRWWWLQIAPFQNVPYSMIVHGESK